MLYKLQNLYREGDHFQLRHPLTKFATHTSGTIWWLNLRLMQVAPSGGRICNLCKQGLTGTRYPTRPDNFWQYPIHTRFIFRIIGYFGYRVFHLFWPNVSVTIQYCFNPHNICQVWTCHQSSLQRIQSMKSYNRDVGTARYKILPIIRHCAPFCTH